MQKRWDGALMGATWRISETQTSQGSARPKRSTGGRVTPKRASVRLSRRPGLAVYGCGGCRDRRSKVVLCAGARDWRAAVAGGGGRPADDQAGPAAVLRVACRGDRGQAGLLQ